MQNPKVLAVICAAVALCALVANHAVARLQIASPKRLPVETFPKTLGSWTTRNERPVDPEVQKLLSTATIVERDYSNTVGNTVNFMLLSADDYKDFHDPNICFPGQGFTLSARKSLTIGGLPFFMMTAAHGADTYRVLYSIPGDYSSGIPAGITLRKMLALNKLFTKREAQSYFLRLITVDEPQSVQAEQKFAEDIVPMLKKMMADQTAQKNRR